MLGRTAVECKILGFENMLRMIFLISCSIIGCKFTKNFRTPSREKAAIKIATINGKLYLKNPNNQEFFISSCNEANACYQDYFSTELYPLGASKKVKLTLCKHEKSILNCSKNPRTLEISKNTKEISPATQASSFSMVEQNNRFRSKSAALGLYYSLTELSSGLSSCGIKKSDKMLESINKITDLGPIRGGEATALLFSEGIISPEKITFQLAGSLQQLQASENPMKKNIRITYVDFKEPAPNRSWQDFFSRNFWKSMIDDFSYHSALMIERIDPQTGKATLVRYISFPDGNDLKLDMNVNYAASEIRRMPLPNISDAAYLEFEDWFRNQNIARVPDNKLDNLKRARRRLKTSFGNKMDLSDSALINLTKSKANRALLNQAVTNYERIYSKQIELGSLTRDAEKNADMIKKTQAEIIQLRNQANTWYEGWDDYRKWVSTNPEAQLKTQVQNQLKEYLSLEHQTFQASKPLSADTKAFTIEKRNQALNAIREAMLIPSNIDLEKFGFNFEDPWKLSSPEEIFEKYHGFSPNDSERFHDLVQRNSLLIEKSIPNLQKDNFYLNRLDLDTYGKGWTEMGDYFKDIYGEYNTSITEFYSKTKAYGTTYTLKSNCACAVARSLNQLYDTSNFKPKFSGITTPKRLVNRVEHFNKIHSEKAKPPLSSGVGKITATAVGAGLSAIVAIAFYDQYQKNFGLTASKNESVCVKGVLQEFYSNTDSLLPQLSFTDFRSNLFEYLESMQ